MAISEMSKMRVAGIAKEEELVLNALAKTGAVELKEPLSLEGAHKENFEEELNALSSKSSYISSTLELLREYSIKYGFKPATSDNVISYKEFEDIKNREKEITQYADEIEKYKTCIYERKGKISELNAAYTKYAPYLCVEKPFSHFKSTEKTKIYLGLVNSIKWENAERELDGFDKVCFEKFGVHLNDSVICVVSHLSSSDEVYGVLTSVGFTACPFTGNDNAKIETENLRGRIEFLEREIISYEERIANLSDKIPLFEILLDRYNYEREKTLDSQGFLRTDYTFILEGFVPTSKCEELEKELNSVTDRLYVEFEEATEEDEPPTLMENGKVVKEFEFLTNMYSVPKYKALDPNAVMSFFFSLFMGIIVADFGYGILMSIACVLFKKIKGDKAPALASVLAIGGLFAVPFGLIFDSFFGYALIHKICLNAFGAGNAYELFYTEHLDAAHAFSSILDISVPTMLLWSLFFGCLHLAAGQFLKGVQELQRKNVFSAIVDGFSWTLFFVGLSVWAFTKVDTFENSASAEIIGKIGLIILIASLVVGVLLSGVMEKGLGKVTKPFVSAYGIINMFSDILSYARLYGLMLSGSQIAAIFTNTIAIEMLFPSGIGGIIGGVLVIVFGNVFNLAMGVLGAYIHDSRLQYVEFYGKFFEGDGRLFKPFGSSVENIKLAK